MRANVKFNVQMCECTDMQMPQCNASAIGDGFFTSNVFVLSVEVLSFGKDLGEAQ